MIYKSEIQKISAMKLQKTLERYKKIDKLIKRENTGTPQEFAGKLGISKSQLYNCLDELRIRGAEIIYNKAKGSYVYQYPVEIRAEFTLSFPEPKACDGHVIYMGFPGSSGEKGGEKGESREGGKDLTL